MFATMIDPTDNGGIGVGFTDRLGGVSTGTTGQLNLGRSDIDEIDHLRQNMALVRRAARITRIAAVHQVHGIDVHLADGDGRDWSGDAWIGDGAPGKSRLPVADAIVSTTPGLALMIRVADCVPVIFADQERGVFAAAHAGRLGLLAGVLPATAQAMHEVGARQLSAWIGPHICGACYEVPEQMAHDAACQLPETRAHTSWGTPAIDLGAGAAAQLQRLGVEVHRVDPCTFTTDTLFSHRGDGPGAGRQIGLVWSAR
ncbi:polyphenol oxidase family protein [Propionimicrobium sp. PCR01-08-3]|uniref:polyphenol oxidase family protein n=1 Tax=Propionimicrobium sp. PCR01-08-3 TaxID=3052086 RepID=UPI00255C47E3|nr:polyphenol oxidase family protein [Propionimicrobium sp. PCR01-08-3]WIY81642.1 polyphenol oxidase family protein [Propionimicrobium sp. PCR01-08-3]